MNTTDEQFICPKCGQGFASLKWLRRHLTVWGHKCAAMGYHRAGLSGEHKPKVHEPIARPEPK